MFKRILLLFFVIISFIGCSKDFQYYMKVINDVNSEYKFSKMEVNWDEYSASFYLMDKAHDDLSMDEMQSQAIIINEFIINKYPKIDSLKFKHYIFSGVGDFEIAKFTLDQNKKVVKAKRLLD